MRPIGISCGYLVLLCLSLLAGCGPENGELASPPVGVVYQTGDMNDTIDGQMGLANGGATASVTGGLGFAGEAGANNARNNAQVSCGPHGTDFRLRFVPQDATSPVLILVVPEPSHGGHPESHDHEEGREARAVVLRVDQGRLSELTGTARVSRRAATHSAGRSAASGTFTAEVGGVTLEGEFASCYYFKG